MQNVGIYIYLSRIVDQCSSDYHYTCCPTTLIAHRPQCHSAFPTEIISCETGLLGPVTQCVHDKDLPGISLFSNTGVMQKQSEIHIIG